MTINEQIDGLKYPDGSAAPPQTARQTVACGAIASVSLVPQVDEDRQTYGHLLVVRLQNGTEFHLGGNLDPKSTANLARLNQMMATIEQALRDPAMASFEVDVLNLS